MPSPLISVVMLTYNRRQYLERSTESIRSQDFNDFEFIIVNNGSTDDSPSLCEGYAKKDRRIRIIHKNRGNIGSGRNAGVEASHGRYITFVDDDDYAYPDMLSFLYALITEFDADVSFCGSDKEINGEISPNCVFSERILFTPQEAVEKLLDRRLLNAATPTKLFSREILEKYTFSEERHYEDIFITYKFFGSAKRVAAHGIPKYSFARHSLNNSRFTNNDHLLTPTQLDEYFDAYKERGLWLINKFPEMAGVVNYSEWSFLISMYHKILSNNITTCGAQLEYIRKILLEHLDEFRQSKYCKPFEHEYLGHYFPEVVKP